MAGTEDVRTHLDNNQVQFIARCIEDPSKLGDILPVGFGEEERRDDELTEEDGRVGQHGPHWVGREGKKDGFTSTLTRMASILPEGKPSYGGPCQRINIKEVVVRPCGGKGSDEDPGDPKAWEKEISRAGIGGAYVYSDGSLLEGGSVGGGAVVIGVGGEEVDMECEVGDIATVWDGEVAGMAEGLTKACWRKNILILADSQAAISAVKRAGRIGKARSHHFRKVINEIRGREQRLVWDG